MLCLSDFALLFSFFTYAYRAALACWNSFSSMTLTSRLWAASWRCIAERKLIRLALLYSFLVFFWHISPQEWQPGWSPKLLPDHTSVFLLDSSHLTPSPTFLVVLVVLALFGSVGGIGTFFAPDRLVDVQCSPARRLHQALAQTLPSRVDSGAILLEH